MQKSDKPSLVLYVLGFLIPVMMFTIYFIIRNSPILANNIAQGVVGVLLGLSLLPAFLLFGLVITTCHPDKQKTLLASSILGCLYSSYLIYGAFRLQTLSSEAGIFGDVIVGIINVFYIPGMMIVMVATVFSILAYIKNSFAFALTSGILFSIMFLSLFTIPLLILCFVGANNIKSTSTSNPLSSEL